MTTLPPTLRNGEGSTIPMKVQVFEPFAGWHHTKYVAEILPTLVRLRDAGAIDDVIVTTTRSHYESSYFKDLLTPFEASVTWDIVDADHQKLNAVDVARMLIDSVARTGSDFIISTSGNNGLFPLALMTAFRSEFRHRDIASVAIIHNGFAEPPTSLRNRFSDIIQRLGRRFGPWSELHVVNPLLYATIKARVLSRGRIVRLLPNPQSRPEPMSKAEARALLGIPIEGRYVGQVGKSDPRKALPELLAAFRAGAQPEDRLLIAGQLHQPYRALLTERYGDFLEQKRIIVLDRFLTTPEMYAAYFALDVVSVAYYTDELSGNLLTAVACGRPVIAARRGYSGLIIDRFGVGFGADILNPHDFAATLARALDGAATYVPSAAAERLIAFNDPQNFVDVLLTPLYQRIGFPTAQISSWEWALDGA